MYMNFKKKLNYDKQGTLSVITIHKHIQLWLDYIII